MNRKTPLIIGEVLFDEFGSDRRVLGGAPLNVAWNLKGCGLDPLFVSAVGDDDAGREVQDALNSWQLDTRFLQVSPTRPTGRVAVHVEDGSPTYEILDQQAYDDIRFPELGSREVEGLGLLYYGSLASRHETTSHTIRRLAAELNMPRFVDINIREPWFDAARRDEFLKGARWIKMNDQELAQLTDRICRTDEDIATAVGELRDVSPQADYWVTRADAGAHVFAATGETYAASAPPPEEFVDSVGAGDAFSAAVIFGILNDVPLEQILRRAVKFGALTCSIAGALTDEPDHYRQLVELYNR